MMNQIIIYELFACAGFIVLFLLQLKILQNQIKIHKEIRKR